MEKIKPQFPRIPDKKYFRIGEVSEITGTEAYVLRFWQKEFKGINPKRTESGQRLYQKADIELILKIKYLLHEKNFTIKGAKRYLKETEALNAYELLEEIRKELLHIRDILN